MGQQLQDVSALFDYCNEYLNLQGNCVSMLQVICTLSAQDSAISFAVHACFQAYVSCGTDMT